MNLINWKACIRCGQNLNSDWEMWKSPKQFSFFLSRINSFLPLKSLTSFVQNSNITEIFYQQCGFSIQPPRWRILLLQLQLQAEIHLKRSLGRISSCSSSRWLGAIWPRFLHSDWATRHCLESVLSWTWQRAWPGFPGPMTRRTDAPSRIPRLK